METVQADSVHMSAKMAKSTGASSTVETLTLPNGGTVQEYVDADGMVFGVSWRGPSRPDLQQLLGDSFATLQADNSARGIRRTRAPLAVHRAELVVQTGGHPGGFWGSAYLPQQLPAGFSLKDLHSR